MQHVSLQIPCVDCGNQPKLHVLCTHATHLLFSLQELEVLPESVLDLI